MNYLTLKLKYCQEIIKEALYLAINEYALTDDEIKAKLREAIKLAIKQSSNSEYKFVVQAVQIFYVMINQSSKIGDISKGKIAKSVKFNTTDTSSFTEYITNLKVDITHYIKILQESYIENITELIKADSIKTIINDNSKAFEQMLLLIKEPIKFNITELSSSSASLNMVMIDKSIPFAIIEYSESDNLIECKIASSKRIKIDKTSKTTYRYYPSLYEIYNLKKYDDIEWNNINNLKLDQIYGREI